MCGQHLRTYFHDFRTDHQAVEHKKSSYRDLFVCWNNYNPVFLGNVNTTNHSFDLLYVFKKRHLSNSLTIQNSTDVINAPFFVHRIKQMEKRQRKLERSEETDKQEKEIFDADFRPNRRADVKTRFKISRFIK